MISLEGVPSSLILRNESWVRQQAASLARRLPSNVERADLIQAGLIAVAQAACSFEWEGDRDSDGAREAFVRYARLRVKGAMLDELRQMDHLGRAERRQVKLLEVARERWRAEHGADPDHATLARLCGLAPAAVPALLALARAAQTTSIDEANDDEGARRGQRAPEPATPADEVEARVDTGLLMRRLERFFAKLPERDRRILDAYLGVGLSPVALADELQLSRSRLSQVFGELVERIRLHQGGEAEAPAQRAADQLPGRAATLEALIEARRQQPEGAWARGFETVLAGGDEGEAPIVIGPHTRWG